MKHSIIILTIAIILLSSCDSIKTEKFSSDRQVSQISEINNGVNNIEQESTVKTLANEITTSETICQLKTDGNSLLVSVLTVEPKHFKWVKYGDGTQFSIDPDEDLILTIYNGRYLSLGNAIMYGNEVYVPYTLLEAVGMEHTITNGFGTTVFTFENAVIRIPWTSDYYVIENNNQYIEEKRVQIYHNDILYIPAARILTTLGFTVEYAENMPGNNSYASLIISDNKQTPNITIDQAKILLNDAVYKLYASEIKQTESELAEGRMIYTDEAFERLKNDIKHVTMEYFDTYGDYYVFKLSDYPIYTYVNMYNSEVYFNDRWSLPELHMSNGIMRVADLYY